MQELRRVLRLGAGRIDDIGGDDHEVGIARDGEQRRHDRILGLVTLPRVAEHGERGSADVGEVDRPVGIGAARPGHGEPAPPLAQAWIAEQPRLRVAARLPEHRGAHPREPLGVGRHQVPVAPGLACPSGRERRVTRARHGVADQPLPAIWRATNWASSPTPIKSDDLRFLRNWTPAK